MDKNKKNIFLVGTAIATGVVSTLATFFMSRNHQRTWGSQARDVSNKIMRPFREIPEDNFNRNFLIGGVAAGILAATTALLMAPKPGKELFQQMAEGIREMRQNIPMLKANGARAVHRRSAVAAKQVNRKSESRSNSRRKSSKRRKVASV